MKDGIYNGIYNGKNQTDNNHDYLLLKKGNVSEDKKQNHDKNMQSFLLRVSSIAAAKASNDHSRVNQHDRNSNLYSLADMDNWDPIDWGYAKDNSPEDD